MFDFFHPNITKPVDWVLKTDYLPTVFYPPMMIPLDISCAQAAFSTSLSWISVFCIIFKIIAEPGRETKEELGYGGGGADMISYLSESGFEPLDPAESSDV